MKKGFTLIELLVVIFIIGILASLLLSNMVGIRTRTEDLKLKNDLIQMKKALRLYYNDHESYPPADGNDLIDSTYLDGDSFTNADGSAIYMRELPEDYEYHVAADGEAFRLIARVQGISSSDIEDSQQRCPNDGVFNSINYDANMYVVCQD